VSRWRFNFGDHPREPAELERLILEKLASEAPEKVETAKSFLEHRYGAHLRNYRRWGGKYSVAFTVTTLLVVTSGVLSSSIGTGWRETHWAKVWLLVLGLVTAVGSALNYLWRPGRKGTGRMRGANRLSTEGWNFVIGTGRYRGMDVHAAYALFVEEVGRILADTAAVDEADFDLPSAPGGEGS
jgi:hypothetical protein